MIAVGLVYLLLALNLSSLLVAPEQVYLFFPTYDAPLDSVAFAATADLGFLAGLVYVVIGGFLLWASRHPKAHVVLVPLIIAIELVAGIIDDLYFILMRDYTVDAIFFGFIVLHLVVIATGYFVYQRAE